MADPKKPDAKPEPEVENPELADSLPDHGAEDALFEFWQENRNRLIGLAVLVIVGTGAFFGLKAYRLQQEAALQTAFLEAASAGTLAEFAEANAGTPLGGFAALRVAADAVADDQVGEARAWYEKAVTGLAGEPLEGKAKLGLAAAAYRLDDAATARTLWAALADDPTEERAVRTEALYLLATDAYTTGEAEAGSTWTDRLVEIDPQSPWIQQLDYFREAQPLPVVEPAEPAEDAAAVETIIEAGEAGASELPSPPESAPEAPASDEPAS